jgi:hypothetical protein
MPSTNGDSGRDHGGRFTTGNKLGRGNPFNKRACELRSALMKAVGPNDVQEIAQALVAAAKGGCVVSAREILNRVLGTPSPTDMLARLEQLEETIYGQHQRQS